MRQVCRMVSSLFEFFIVAQLVAYLTADCKGRFFAMKRGHNISNGIKHQIRAYLIVATSLIQL